MRSLYKNDLRNTHVIEEMWFVFLRVMSCDDDCLSGPNANYSEWTNLTDVLLLAVGAIMKLKKQKSLKFCHGLPIQVLLRDRWRSCFPVEKEADTFQDG